MSHCIPRGRSRTSGGFLTWAVIAGIGLAVLGHHGTTVPAHTTAAVRGGTLGCSGLEQLWDAEGGSPAAASTAASVAMAESSGDPNATNANSNGTTDRGYWQINSTWGALSTYDPAGNARAAVQISHDGTDWNPWVTYASGAYAGRC
jgi:Lysozyme like domain